MSTSTINNFKDLDNNCKKSNITSKYLTSLLISEDNKLFKRLFLCIKIIHYLALPGYSKLIDELFQYIIILCFNKFCSVGLRELVLIGISAT
ncbi:hypothetical protein RCL_jg28225.t1 [Rhizophagus clarus]|uniref:Uncharacterized protein n=1 Tax=Rhizophagus clarus TaxID=94130 RepID=A0A8H3LQD1_9GLOM|nr:hypothetical protein RCL_jg28225.t1 [Rhizophagus clarus]